jgi:hypothetical protein
VSTVNGSFVYGGVSSRRQTWEQSAGAVTGGRPAAAAPPAGAMIREKRSVAQERYRSEAEGSGLVAESIGDRPEAENLGHAEIHASLPPPCERRAPDGRSNASPVSPPDCLREHGWPRLLDEKKTGEDRGY